MKIYLADRKDVELESPISPHQLIVIIDASMHGLCHAQILARQGERTGRVDVRDIDRARTLPDAVFESEASADTLRPTG